MKTILPILVTLSFALFSCGDSDKNTGSNTNPDTRLNTNLNSSTDSSATGQNKPEDQNKIKNTSETNTSNSTDGIRVTFPKGSTQVTVNGKIKGLGDQVAYVFEVSKGQTLNASVKPSKGIGNIRFNQIFSPSGNIDGPFSNVMTYNLNVSGDWKLIIGESNMEGDPYVGEFLLTLAIK